MTAHRRGIQLLTAICALLLFVSLSIFVARYSFHASALTANGVVDKISKESESIRVRFTPKGKGDHYLTLEGRRWIRTMHKGDGLVVVYAKADPNNAQLDTNFPFWLLPVFIFIVALLGLVASRRWSGWVKHQEYLTNKIWLEGGVLVTNFERIDKDRKLSTPEQGIWRVVSSWTDVRTLEVFEFQSKPLKFYPDELLLARLIKVTIHPDDDNPTYEFDKKFMAGLKPTPS